MDARKCYRMIVLAVILPAILLAIIISTACMMSRERDAFIESGETVIWGLSEQSLLNAELMITSSSHNVSIFYYSNPPILKLSRPVTLTGKYWLNPAEHVMYSHFFERGSIISLAFTSVQGANFFIFKGNEAYMQYEKENQADYLLLRLSTDGIEERLNLKITSSDTYYIVFDNIYDDFYSRIQFKLSLKMNEYTNDMNTNYKEIYPLVGTGDDYVLLLSFFSFGYLIFKSTNEQQLLNTTTNKKINQMWSPTKHVNDYIPSNMTVTVKGTLRWNMIFWLFFVILLSLSYFMFFIWSNKSAENEEDEEDDVTLQNDYLRKGTIDSLQMTVLLELSAKKRLLKQISDDGIRNKNSPHNNDGYSKSNDNISNLVSSSNSKSNSNSNNSSRVTTPLLKNTSNTTYHTNNNNLSIDKEMQHAPIVTETLQTYFTQFFSFFSQQNKKSDDIESNLPNRELRFDEPEHQVDKVSTLTKIATAIQTSRKTISAFKEDISKRGRIILTGRLAHQAVDTVYDNNTSYDIKTYNDGREYSNDNNCIVYDNSMMNHIGEDSNKDNRNDRDHFNNSNMIIQRSSEKNDNKVIKHYHSSENNDDTHINVKDDSDERVKNMESSNYGGNENISEIIRSNNNLMTKYDWKSHMINNHNLNLNNNVSHHSLDPNSSHHSLNPNISNLTLSPNNSSVSHNSDNPNQNPNLDSYNDDHNVRNNSTKNFDKN